jgi:plastocyanin
VFLGISASGAFAAEQALTVTLKDHKFSPDRFEVKAGDHVKITVINQDKSAEEFESKPFHIESVVGGNKTAVFNLGPVKTGEYLFVGEYHEDMARGTIVVK